jgi:hypothetical protein
VSYSIDPLTPTELMDIAESLPHDSGFNGLWYGEVTKNYVNFSIIYSPFDAHGYYDGYVELTVKLPLVDNCIDWYNFHVEFNGRKSRYYAKKHDLLSYIDNTVYDSLSAYSDW